MGYGAGWQTLGYGGGSATDRTDMTDVTDATLGNLTYRDAGTGNVSHRGLDRPSGNAPNRG